MLIAEVFVGEDEEVEPSALGDYEQVSIFDPCPALYLDGGDFVACEGVAHLCGDTFVEEDFHAAA